MLIVDLSSLTETSSCEKLNRSETFEPKSANPTAGWLEGGREGMENIP